MNRARTSAIVLLLAAAAAAYEQEPLVASADATAAATKDDRVGLRRRLQALPAWTRRRRRQPELESVGPASS